MAASCDLVRGGGEEGEGLPCRGDHRAFGGACVAAPLPCVGGSGVPPCSCEPC